jgi:hypothetical protein
MAALTHSIRFLPVDDADSVVVKVHRLFCDDRDDEGDEDDDKAMAISTTPKA